MVLINLYTIMQGLNQLWKNIEKSRALSLLKFHSNKNSINNNAS